MMSNRKSGNPFNIGSCARGEGFFDREAILKEIAFFLETNSEHYFLIHGQRRIGKTSLLRHIQDQAPPLVHPVYYDLQDCAWMPLPQLLGNIAKQIAVDLDTQPGFANGSLDADRFTIIIKQFTTDFKEEELLLLLFDEFDVLGNPAAGTGTDSGENYAAHQFIPFVRRWIEELADNQLPVKLIFAAGRNYRDLRETQYGQLLKFGTQKELEYFKSDDVKNLVFTLIHDELPFEEEAVETLYSLTAGHPYFTQALAGAAFKSGWELEQQSITKENVYAAFEPAIEAVSGGINWFWSQFSPHQKILLYIITHLEEEQRIISRETIETVAIEKQLLPGLENFTETINQLVRAKILKPCTAQLCAGFQVPFFRKWIVHEVRQQELMTELLENSDNTDADIIALKAKHYYHKKHDLTTALKYFNSILLKNPGHPESIYYCGIILYKLYRKNGNPQYLLQAAEKAEWIYQNDPVKSQELWERVLLELIIKQHTMLLDEKILAKKICTLKQPGKIFQDKAYTIIKQSRILLGALLATLELTDILRLTDADYLFPREVVNGGKDAVILFLSKLDITMIDALEKKLKTSLELIEKIAADSKGYVVNPGGQVTGLGLSGCNISDLCLIRKELLACRDLVELNLSNNKIEDTSSLKEITRLTYLNLNYNRIKDITPIAELKNLEVLSVRHNAISDPAPLGSLTKLVRLYLENNQFRDISPLSGLRNLRVLGLGSNRITNLSALEHLAGLETLSVYNNAITGISALRKLTNLTSLNLRNTHLKNVDDLSGLVNLYSLDLSDNFLCDVQAIKELKNLGTLNLRNNKIESLSFLRELDNLKDIDITGNPLTDPAHEIANAGIEAIRNYYKQLSSQGTERLYEAKIMIVGEPGAGKSTLLRKLFNRSYPAPDPVLMATTGIEVQDNWSFPLDAGEEFRVQIWDFGGQQIQYMLHQFFLTESCLYILMAEKRKELTNFDYWLNILNTLGKRSSIILLFNEIDLEGANSFVFDERKYRELFPDSAFIRLDINLANITDGRFDVLVDRIKQQIRTLPHVGRVVPAAWKSIREALYMQKYTKLMPVEAFFQLCSEHNLTGQQDQLLLLHYFHLLGTILHFQDDPQLKDTLFLDPNWTVNAIYSVLSDKRIEQYKGTVPYRFIKELWEQKGFTVTEQTRLLGLMLKDGFEFCYPCPVKRDHYIIPILLPREKPRFDWQEEGNLHFRFQYPFMPRGIVNRLVVRLNAFIENNTVWQEGAVFTIEGARVLVEEKQATRDGLKIIEISLARIPEKRKELLTLVRQEIKYIQQSSFPNLPYSEMVPCQCTECRDNIDKSFYDYTDLVNIITKGKKQIICMRSGEDVNIPELIDAVYDRVMLKVNDAAVDLEANQRNRYILKGDLIMGDRYSQIQGIQGKNVNAHNNTFSQTNFNFKDLDIDYAKLVNELQQLINVLEKQAVTDEEIDSAGEVKKAIAAAKQKNTPKLLGHLQKVGKWVMDTAIKIGTPLTVEIIKQLLGL